ncbi:hypothetical protein FPV67DRAFT_162451 [Lyophyllum atratum]|nr:hypothetical protein FPV67DRAFT_162451 [Lyophyllum atratum]
MRSSRFELLTSCRTRLDEGVVAFFVVVYIILGCTACTCDRYGRRWLYHISGGRWGLYLILYAGACRALYIRTFERTLSSRILRCT